MFALTTIMVVSLVGGAVDYGRATTAREQIQNAVDASVLAAVRVWQTENNMALAEEKGMMYYEKNKPRHVESAVSGFAPDLARNAIVMEATGQVPTPFLSMVRSGGYEVYARGEALLAVGGNAETNLEISLMLDVTGSMAGQKLTDLKAAAKDLIDIVVWSDQSEYTSKVALAPFADRINTGAYTSMMTGLPATRSVTTTTSNLIRANSQGNGNSGNGGWGNGNSGNSGWDNGNSGNGNSSNGNSGNGNSGGGSTTTTTTEYLISCVTDRWGVAQNKDDAPAATPNTYVGPYVPANGNSAIDLDSQYSSTGACDRPVSEIMPLTSDKVALKARIDSFVADGGTAGALGTEMAWFLISPNWAGVWPADSQPVAYGTPKYQKIAVLMTDGEYNRYKGQSWNSSSVSAFAKSTCREMKRAGVVVYTVGFQLDSSQAEGVLSDCATDSSKFYNAADGDALRAAFRDIALQIAKLRLSQ